MCVFTVYYTGVYSITSRKRNCQYLEGKARCKILTCQITIRICTSKEEITKGNPKVNVTTRVSYRGVGTWDFPSQGSVFPPQKFEKILLL